VKKFRSWIEISSKNLKNNIVIIRNILGKDAKIISVIKANAYGHGLVQIAKLLELNKIDVLSVFSLEEAIELIKNNIRIPILILGPVFNFEIEQIKKLANRGIIFTVHDFKSLFLLEEVAKDLKNKIKIHLKIDTGMGRLGFNVGDAISAFKKIFHSKFLQIDGVFSHFYAADSCNPEPNLNQIKIFNNVLKEFQKIDKDIYKTKIHFEKSAALQFRQILKNSGCNFVRVGIIIYGMNPFLGLSKPNPDIFKDIKPILSWKTRIGEIKNLPPNHCVSYDCTYKTVKKTKIAILPVGYYEGLDRRFSNNGFVKIKNKYAPILGRVCMDLVVVDISKINGVKVGDEVIIIDNKPDSLNSADNMAERIGTINYEITTKLDIKLPRIII